MHIGDIARLTNTPVRTIREIPAHKVMTTAALIGKIRECAYARVSTDNKEQLTSYEMQKKFYEQDIKARPNSEFAGIYCDDVSGKSIAGRKGFKQLLEDCYAGKIDRIITKSVARFARNMVECMQIARDLRNRGITIYFESQGLDTTDESSFFVLGILAAMAEEEIRTISRNVIWGIQKRYREGKVHMSGRMYGYKIKSGQFTIVPSEVETVRQIFNDYLEGKTVRQIANQLEKDGIPTAMGKKKWHHTSLLNMLQNEKYIGDVILQKTFKVDILSPRQKNMGQRDKFEVLNNHTAIVDRGIFFAVQGEIQKREYEKITLSNERTRYSSHYPLSTKLECKECGTKFRRHSQQHGEKKVDIWVCMKHQKTKAECGMKPIKEQVVEESFLQVLNGLVAERARVIENIEQSVAKILTTMPLKDIRELEKQLVVTEKQLVALSKHTPQTTELQNQAKALIADAKNLREEIVIAEKTKGKHDLINHRVSEIKQVLKVQYFEYKGEVFRSLIEKVIVKDKKTVRFIFKCGMEREHQVA